MADAARSSKGEFRMIPGSASKDSTFDPMIHERMRLGILSVLAVNEKLTFGDLKQQLEASDGNLSVHCRKLEEAKYLKARKFFEGRTPRTEYRMTARGRKALERYLDYMEALIRQVRDV